MRAYSGFENTRLEGHIARSRQAERDLQDRVAKRISEVEREGLWLRSDPLYQRLSSVLSSVRQDLTSAEQELLRRCGAAGKPLASSPTLGGPRPV